MARDTWVRSRAGRVCVCGPARSRAKFLGELYWFWCIFALFFGFLAPGARRPNNPFFATSSHFAQQQERCVSSKVALLLVSLFSATPLLIGFFSSSSWRIASSLPHHHTFGWLLDHAFAFPLLLFPALFLVLFTSRRNSLHPEINQRGTICAGLLYPGQSGP